MGAALYFYLKAFHIISFVAWFAGLFYIYRLFVYHIANRENLDVCRVLTIMEKKLLRYIMAPAAFLTIAFGLGLLRLRPGIFVSHWIWIKISLVVILLAYHGSAYYTFTHFMRRDWVWTEKQCRMINEIPTVLLIGIVILAVLKPF